MRPTLWIVISTTLISIIHRSIQSSLCYTVLVFCLHISREQSSSFQLYLGNSSLVYIKIIQIKNALTQVYRNDCLGEIGSCHTILSGKKDNFIFWRHLNEP